MGKIGAILSLPDSIKLLKIAFNNFSFLSECAYLMVLPSFVFVANSLVSNPVTLSPASFSFSSISSNFSLCL